eukprot:GHVS01054502.1.p1 GENE.GHVS01054502.1~~GHVS01054502.1.p1  ORF type:complete len:204 (-),score=11.85 GHVS01054502.1:1259-1870(-)
MEIKTRLYQRRYVLGSLLIFFLEITTGHANWFQTAQPLVELLGVVACSARQSFDSLFFASSDSSSKISCITGGEDGGSVWGGIQRKPGECRNCLSSPADLLPSYDFVVIGAGTAGSIVAARLAEHCDKENEQGNEGCSVLLLEAGPPMDTRWYGPDKLPAAALYGQQSVADWNFTTEAQPHAAQVGVAQPHAHSRDAEMRYRR